MAKKVETQLTVCGWYAKGENYTEVGYMVDGCEATVEQFHSKIVEMGYDGTLEDVKTAERLLLFLARPHDWGMWSTSSVDLEPDLDEMALLGDDGVITW